MAYAPLTKIPQQFFNNLGNPLVGGTISAFLAGTSTPTNMFSDNAGTVAGTTVTLDSRGEPTTFKLIWVSTTVIYKFVLKDSTGTTIWTIDNISGDDGTGNTASSVFDQQTITATAGQTVFNLGYSYITGTNAMAVYKNGSRLITSTDFTETSSTSVTLTMAAIAGDEYTFIGGQDVSSSFSSSNVSFIQSGTGAITRSVQTKLREIVSVKDFGAVGDGSIDDTLAIQAAIDATPVYGTTFFPAGTYIIINTLNLKSNLTIDGQGATIRAKAAVNFEYMMLAASKTNVTVKNIRFDANKTNRSSGQTIRFMCLGFTDCDDCTASNVYVENARGYSSIPAVGLVVGGSSIRCKIENCTAVNCGDSGANAADGFFASGESNLIIGCLATNCTDTGFVIESSNISGIVGCIARSCNAGAAITNAVNSDKYGNFISGVSVFDWNSTVTGGIQIGCPLSTSTGSLYDTVISDVSVVAVTAGKGTGPAINLRQTGTPKAVRVTLNNVRIRTASAQGILVDADQVAIRGCDISGTTSACIQFQDGSVSNFVAGCQLIGGSFGVITTGNASVVCESNSMLSQTSYGVFAFDTSTITSMFNVVQSPAVNFFGKDAGAALNLVGSQTNNLSVNNATGTATSGSIVNKFVVTDANGTPLGYIPVYNT